MSSYGLCPNSGKSKAKSATIKFAKGDLKELDFLDPYLTDVQKKKKRNQIKNGGNLLLTLSIPTVKKIYEQLIKKKQGSGLSKHEGGFIGITAAIIGAIAAAASGVASIVTSVHNKQKNDAELEEQKRHNLVMEKTGSGLGTTLAILVAKYGLEKIINALKKKTGKGIFLEKVTKTSSLH